MRSRQEYVKGGEEKIAHAQDEHRREPGEPDVHPYCHREGTASDSLVASGARGHSRTGGSAPAVALGPEWLWQRILHVRRPEHDDELAQLLVQRFRPGWVHIRG